MSNSWYENLGARGALSDIKRENEKKNIDPRSQSTFINRLGPSKPPQKGIRGSTKSFAATVQPPSKAARPGSPFPKAVSPAFTEMDTEGSFNHPPGSINVNQQEVDIHRPIALGISEGIQIDGSHLAERGSRVRPKGPL